MLHSSVHAYRVTGNRRELQRLWQGQHRRLGESPHGKALVQSRYDPFATCATDRPYCANSSGPQDCVAEVAAKPSRGG